MILNTTAPAERWPTPLCAHLLPPVRARGRSAGGHRVATATTLDAAPMGASVVGPDSLQCLRHTVCEGSQTDVTVHLSAEALNLPVAGAEAALWGRA